MPPTASPASPAARAKRTAWASLAFAAAGLALVAFGWLIPSQFKSVPASVLAEAGRGTPSLLAAVRDRLDAGRPGAARMLAEAALAAQVPGAGGSIERVSACAAENAELAFWGEANPYITHAFPPDLVRRLDPGAGIVRHLLPADARKSVSAYLATSPKPAVRAILATSRLQTYKQFLPVHSAGGAPLEASILLAALLVQSEELGEDARRQLRDLAEEAGRTGEAAAVELVYLDLLALGRRCNWGQLAALVRDAGSLEALAKLRHLQRVAADAAPVVMAAVVVSRDPDAAADYVIDYGPRGVEAVRFALHHGAGSLALLLRQKLPVDGDLGLPPKAGGGVARAVDPLVRFAFESPGLAVVAKIALYLAGGLLFFLVGERLTALHRLELSPVFTSAARAVGAGVVCLLLVVFNEPYLALGSQPSGYELRLAVPVVGSSSIATMNETSNAFPVDVATVVSISFFFLLQALVYLVCLLKMKEIQSQNLPSLLKLRLVENEENLFDSGLYVGIAGTSAALVLQVLGVIEANLLAAYSSNLFGILCVAFVKIRHVRPFKQRLILEMARTSETPTARAG
jgi:hypothetical protein